MRFANVAANGRFTTADLNGPALHALGATESLERIYAPLTAGLLASFRGDRTLPDDRRCALDRLYQRICDDLDALLKAVGLKVAA